MFPLQLLCPPLADDMAVGIQVSTILPPAVGVKTANPKRGEQGFELQQHLILTPTKDIRHYPPQLMIQRLPKPPRLLLAADKGPHLVQLSFLYFAAHHCGR